MGQGKSKNIEDGESGNEENGSHDKSLKYTQHPTLIADLTNVKREQRQRVNEDRKLRRKWRRKQGYSLPVVGIDTHSDGEVSGMGTSFRGRRNSQNYKEREAIDVVSQISQDDAILVSYKKDPRKSENAIPIKCSDSYKEKGNRSKPFDNEKLIVKNDFLMCPKPAHNKRCNGASDAIHDNVIGLASTNSNKSKNESLDQSTPDNEYYKRAYGDDTEKQKKKEPGTAVKSPVSFQSEYIHPDTQNKTNNTLPEANTTIFKEEEFDCSTPKVVANEKQKHAERSKQSIEIHHTFPPSLISSNERDNISNISTSLLPSTVGNKTIVEIGSNSHDSKTVKESKNERKERWIESKVSLDEKLSKKVSLKETSIFQTPHTEHGSKEPLLSEVNKIEIQGNNTTSKSNLLPYYQVQDPTQKEQETEKSNSNINFDASNYGIKEGVVIVNSFTNSNPIITTTKPCINKLETTPGLGNQNHHNNSNNNEDGSSDIINTVLPMNNCFTPTINDIDKLPPMDVKDSPTMIKDERLTTPTTLLTSITGVNSLMINANTKPDSDDTICINKDLAPKNHIDKNNDTSTLDYEIGRPLNNHSNNQPKAIKESLQLNPNEEEFEQTSILVNDGMDNEKFNEVDHSTSNVSFQDNNDDQNVNGNRNNRNYGVLFKKKDESSSHHQLIHDEKSNDDNDVQNFNDDDVTMRKPKIGKKIHEKVILFDSKASLPGTFNNDTTKSLEERDIPYLHSDSISSIEEVDNKTSIKDTGTCQYKAVKKSIYKLPLPTEITHILETGSAPKIFECQNLNEFSTNADDEIKSEIQPDESLINEKEDCGKNVDGWVNDTMNDFTIETNIKSLDVENDCQIESQTLISTIPMIEDTNTKNDYNRGDTNVSMMPTREHVLKQKRDINERIRYLLQDESAILIDIDDVVEGEESEEHSEEHDFHHARIAMVDTLDTCSDREPDLSFMPRIEEREEDFLESTVDDDSEDEVKSVSSSLSSNALDVSEQDNDTLANKKFEKHSSRGSNTAGDLYSITTSAYTDMGNNVQLETSFKNPKTFWETNKSDATHEDDFLSHYKLNQPDVSSWPDKLEIGYDEPGMKCNENSTSSQNEQIGNGNIDIDSEQKTATFENGRKYKNSTSIYIDNKKEINITEVSSHLKNINTKDQLECKEFIVATKEECIPSAMEEMRDGIDLGVTKVDSSATIDLKLQTDCNVRPIVKKESVEIIKSSNNPTTASKRVKQKSITIITMDDVNDSPRVLSIGPSENSHSLSINTSNENDHFPKEDKVEETLLQESLASIDPVESGFSVKYDTEESVMLNKKQLETDRYLDTINNHSKDIDEENETCDIYDEHRGTPVDESDEERNEIHSKDLDVNSSNSVDLAAQNEPTSTNEKIRDASGNSVPPIHDATKAQDHVISHVNSNKSAATTGSITTDEDTESDNATLSPFRERKWTTSTDTSFIINDQRRLPPIGCSSDDLQSNSSNSSNSSTHGGVTTSLACYDSLEDLSLRKRETSEKKNHLSTPQDASNLDNQENRKRQKRRSLPRIPVDFSSQQQRAFEILANNCTISSHPQPNFWNQDQVSPFLHGQNNLMVYPPFRHVEGSCDDQQYFGSVKDSHQRFLNPTFDELAPQNQENNPFIDEHSLQHYQVTTDSQSQRKRQLPQVPGNDKSCYLVQEPGSFNTPETSIDIEADEILRYNVEKHFDVENNVGPSETTNIEGSNEQNFEYNDMNNKSKGCPSFCTFEEYPLNNVGDDSGCASMETTNSVSPKYTKESKSSSNFLWFGIDEMEATKTQNVESSTKIQNRINNVKTTSEQIRKNHQLRKQKLSLRNEKVVQSSMANNSSHLKSRAAASFSETSNRKFRASRILDANNEYSSKEKNNLANNLKHSFSHNISSINVDKNCAVKSTRSSSSKVPPDISEVSVGDTAQVLQNSTCI